MEKQCKDEDMEQILGKSILTARMLHLAIAFNPIVFAIVAGVVAKTNAPFHGFTEISDETLRILRYILWPLGAAALPMAMFLRHMMWRTVVRSAQVKTLSDFGAFFLRSSILNAAVLAEPAVWGLILFLLAGSWVDLLGLGAMTLIYMTVMFPTAARVTELAKAAADIQRDQADTREG